MKTLSQMRGVVRDLIDEHAPTPFSDSQINAFINLVYEEIFLDLKEMEAPWGVIATKGVTWPADTMSIELSVLDADLENALDVIGPIIKTDNKDEQWRLAPYSKLYTGRHLNDDMYMGLIARVGDALHIDAKFSIDTDLTISYIPAFVALVDDSDVTILPKRWDALVELRAAVAVSSDDEAPLGLYKMMQRVEGKLRNTEDAGYNSGSQLIGYPSG